MMRAILLIVMIGCLYGCKKEQVIGETVFTRADLPSTTGSYWKYHCRDYGTGDFQYKVIHRIEWTEALSGDTQVLHYSLYNENMTFRDSAIGILTNESFTYRGVTQPQNVSLFENFYLPFPITASSSWVGYNPIDNFNVLWQSDKYMPDSVMYDDVFYMSSVYISGLDVSRHSMHLSKGVGILSKSSFLENAGTDFDRKRTYTLIDYYIE